MKLTIFGLTVSSSWGNGHATLWRGLLRALCRDGHRIAFYERDVPYYAEHRDLAELPAGGTLHLYRDWDEIAPRAARDLADADAAIVTSYCPDGIAAAERVLSSPAKTRIFYDLDTPVTLARLDKGERVEYLPPDGLREFDLVLSYTGGRALDELRSRLGARRAEPLYGWVDPDVHRPAEPLSPLLRGLVGHMSAYEELAVDAALRGGRARVVSALLAHPLIGQYDLAEKMADRLIAENAPFLSWA